MGDITKKRKTYGILEIKEIEDLPPGWKFEINGKSWNFEELANWSERADLAYWFSVVFWRSRKILENDTRTGYWYAYKKFWEFLDYTNKKPTRIEEINTDDFLLFKSWLERNARTYNHNEKRANIDPLTYGTRRKIFGYIRQTIKYLISISVTREDLHLPNVSFPNTSINTEKTLPFSQSERSRVVAACSKEFALIESGEITTHRQIYVPYMLTLALRTGINLQPLIDLTVDSLKPGILDGRLEMTIRKNRGYSSQRISVDDTDNQDQLAYVSKRVGPIIRELIEISASLRADAPNKIASSIFLVPGHYSVGMRVLNSNELWVNIQRFRDKYELKDDAGNPLQINVRRMRPTFAHALLRINGGDLRDLQKRLNHKSIGTTMGYLDANQEDFKSSFKFRGIIMQHALGGGSIESLSSQIQCSLKEAERLISGNNSMLVGTCINPLTSPFKRDGDVSPCSQFMSCFRCHNQVVTKEDAHKIFSFYWYLLNKKNVMPKRAWDKGYEWIIRTIDQDISPGLGKPDEIEKLKLEALKNPYPAWPNDGMGSM